MPLHSVCTADHKDSIIKHLQHTLHLSRKIHMPRRIKKSELNIFPAKDRLLGKYRDAPFPFHLICIKKCIPVIHSSHITDAAAQVEHSLR